MGRCVLMHKWNGCTCVKCGENRDENHQWNGCRCEVCGKQNDSRHQWNRQQNGAAQCTMCGKKTVEMNVFDIDEKMCLVKAMGLYLVSNEGEEEAQQHLQGFIRMVLTNKDTYLDAELFTVALTVMETGRDALLPAVTDDDTEKAHRVYDAALFKAQGIRQALGLG